MHKPGGQLNYLHCKKKSLGVLTQNVTQSLRCTKMTVVRFQTRMLRNEFIHLYRHLKRTDFQDKIQNLCTLFHIKRVALITLQTSKSHLRSQKVINTWKWPLIVSYYILLEHCKELLQYTSNGCMLTLENALIR